MTGSMEAQPWKECKFLDFKQGVVTVGLKTVKIIFIIYKVIFHAVHFRFQNAYILILPVEIHIEMRSVIQSVLHFLGHAYIFGQDHAYVIILFIDTFGQGTYYVCQAARLNERYAFRSHK